MNMKQKRELQAKIANMANRAAQDFHQNQKPVFYKKPKPISGFYALAIVATIIVVGVFYYGI